MLTEWVRLTESYGNASAFAKIVIDLRIDKVSVVTLVG